jgi:2,3,4,5-tetrahydropyridine-2-carboxylate N-succinyltransferase
MTHDHLKTFIDSAYEHAAEITPETKGVVRDAVEEVLDLLDKGELRVAEKRDGGWVVHQWLKKAILLSFRLHEPHKVEGGPDGAAWWDKVPTKFTKWKAKDFKEAGFRIVPGAVVRRSAYIAPGVVLMPSFVNLGARVSQAPIDTWATVGSCAQIGKNVHLGRRRHRRRARAAPGEPRDHRGHSSSARAEVAEASSSAKGRCCRWASTSASRPRSSTGRPASFIRAACRPTRSSCRAPCQGSHSDGSPSPSLYCAVIVKTVDEKTRAKTSINELLRD